MNDDTESNPPELEEEGTALDDSGSNPPTPKPTKNVASDSEDPSKTCPSCGTAIPEDGPDGLCPQCLVAGGMFAVHPTGGLGNFTPPTAQELDALLDAYDVEEIIGRGGMGAVYKARQTHLNRTVAIKVLPVEGSAFGPNFADRFKREAQAMARLSHPNIVTVHDFGHTDQGYFYFVMEYVDGADLQKMIQTGEVTPEQALAIVPQICEALQFAHSKGAVHRDIKPGNILVTKEGVVKVTDFGLVKILGIDTGFNTLTVTGTVMGTPNYVAPEQLDPDAPPDHRSDIYSLGVVFYELLTGTLPKGVFEPPSKKVEIDVRLDEVVLRAMQEKPEKRYQQASEIKSTVEGIRDSGRGRARRPKGARNPLMVVTIALVSVALGLFGGLWIVQQVQKNGTLASSEKETPEGPVTAERQTPPESETPTLAPTVNPKPSVDPPTPPLAKAPVEIDEETRQLYKTALEELKTDPGKTEEKVRIALENLKRVNPRIFALKSTYQINEGQLEVDLSGNHALIDLTPLRGLPIAQLNLSHSLLDDIPQLLGMPLQHLDLSETDVEDLTPLSGAPIRKLNLAHTKISDVSVLDGMPLEDLDLSYTHPNSMEVLIGEPLKRLIMRGANFHTANLSFLRHRFLTEIDIAGLEGDDLSWLENDDLQSVVWNPGPLGTPVERLLEAPRLERIGVWDPSVSWRDPITYLDPDEFWRRYEQGNYAEDDEALQVRINQALEQLEADNPQQSDWAGVGLGVGSDDVRLNLQGLKKLTDLSALAGLPITHLNLQGSPNIVELAPLQTCPLVSLDLTGCRVTDISPLAALPLRGLFLGLTKVRDFEPLKGLPLQTLQVGDTPFADLDVLTELPLRQLGIDSCTQLVNLSGLNKLCLRELDIRNLPSLKDLDLLKGMPLRSLTASNPSITDLEPLRGMPLAYLSLNGTSVTQLAPLRGMKLEYFQLPRTDMDPRELLGIQIEHMDFEDTWWNGNWDALRSLTSLQSVDVGQKGTIPIREFWKRYDAGEWSSNTDSAKNETPFVQEERAPEATFDYTAAIALLKSNPAAIEAQFKEALNRLKSDHPDADLQGLPQPTVSQEELSLNLSNQPNLKDITALHGLPITHLDLSHTAVADLSPLTGMPIRDLNISHTEVRDVSALESMPLQRLRYDPVRAWKGFGDLWRSDTLREIGLPDQEEYLPAGKFWGAHANGDYVSAAIEKALEQLETGNRKQIDWQHSVEVKDGEADLNLGNHSDLEDISSLKGLPLTYLDVRGTKIADISALKGMPLRVLYLNNCPSLTGLDALKDLPLKELYLDACGIADLNSLKGLQLTNLDISHTRVTDYSPIQELPLESLRMGGSDSTVVDINSLANLPLKELTIEQFNEDIDWNPLSTLTSLENLTLNGAPIRNLNVLRNLPLEQLYVNNCELEELGPLKGLSLRTLDLLNTKVVDLTPLEGMPLEQLNLEGTEVADLTPLRNSKLTSLHCWNTAVTDLTPLTGLPLVDITISPGKAGKGMEALRAIPTLERISPEHVNNGAYLEVADFWERYDASQFEREIKLEKALAELKKANPDQQEWNNLHYGANDARVSLRLSNLHELSNLEPLRGLPLTEIRIYDTNVADLSPLKGMALEVLKIQNSPVHDISAIAGMPLREINFNNIGNVRDFEPLRGLDRLTNLHYSGMQEPLRDATLLSGKELEHLYVAFGDEVTDLNALKGMPLETMELYTNAVTDLSPLAGMPLTQLTLYANGLQSTSGLGDLPVENLQLYAHKLEDISALSDLKQIRSLHISSNDLTDISPLLGLPLVTLDFTNCGSLRDTTPLQGLPNLEVLFLYQSPIRDLRPLKGMLLKELIISQTKTDDLSPLQGMPLQHLSVSRTPIYDLEPLSGMPLRHLSCYDTGVRDLTPLEGMPLNQLKLSPKRIVKGMETVRQIKSIQTFVVDGEDLSKEKFWKRYDAGEYPLTAPGESRE